MKNRIIPYDELYKETYAAALIHYKGNKIWAKKITLMLIGYKVK